jgi:hypothetical protein
MKEKNAKLKLEDIKVESFITSLDENAANKMVGGTGGDDTANCQSLKKTWCGDYTCGCPYTWNTCATSPQMNCCVDI